VPPISFEGEEPKSSSHFCQRAGAENNSFEGGQSLPFKAVFQSARHRLGASCESPSNPGMEM